MNAANKLNLIFSRKYFKLFFIVTITSVYVCSAQADIPCTVMVLKKRKNF